MLNQIQVVHEIHIQGIEATRCLVSFTNVYLSDYAVVIKWRRDQARQPLEKTAMVINGRESSTLFLGSHQLSTTHRKGLCLLVRCGPSSQLGPWTIFTPCLQARVIPSNNKVPSLRSQFCSMKVPYESMFHLQLPIARRRLIVSGVRSCLPHGACIP